MARNTQGFLTSEGSRLVPASTAIPHSPALDWSYRAPSPPRITVPPPTLDGHGVPDITIGNGSPFDFESNGFANSDFLNTVTYGDFMTENHMLDWKYEQRRMAQAILPFLYLGPLSAARDRQYLQREGISMVLAVRNTMSAQARLLGSKAAVELGIQSLAIDVAGNQELIAAFPKAIDAINAHLTTMYQRQQSNTSADNSSEQITGRLKPGKVLVFCESGNERSAAVVAAYIMAMYSMDLIKTIQVVQAQRFCVSFDDSLKTLLQSYDTILRAKRDIVQYEGLRRADNKAQSGSMGVGGQQQGLEGAAMGKSTKRTLDEVYDADMDMHNAYGPRDEERFGKREGYAPFEDRAMS
ncbi:hypothetical protein MMC24_004344 [Lignoscripta atroalba]|nr:hypothetical protein [Lignoscripta atroalba]